MSALRRRLLVASITPVLVLCGCAGLRSASGASHPGGTASTAVNGAAGDGAPHEAENQRYRQRMPVAAASRASLEAARVQVRRGLQALDGPPSEQDVRKVLTSAGAPDPWLATDPAEGVVFEAQVAQDGCLLGSVSGAGRVVVRTGGFIADGGCHALTGH